jgi:hypothetical protein
MCEIIMLIFGIIALIRGRFLLTRVKEVRGWPARIIGVLLILPFPLGFLLGMVLGAIFLAMGKEIGGKDFTLAAQIVGFVVVVICFLAAIVVAMIFAQPIRKYRPEPIETALPDDYGDRFQAREHEASESQDITGGTPSPSAPPDDRIQS